MSGDNALVQTVLGFACSRLCKFVWLSFGRYFNGLSLFRRHVTRFGTLAICLAEKLFQTPLSSRNLDHHENAEPLLLCWSDRVNRYVVLPFHQNQPWQL